VKVLFFMRHAGYVRNFESTLRMLCDRGHQVHVAFQGRVKYAQLDPADIARRLSEQHSRFSYGDAPLRADGWGIFGRELRLELDYLRYLGPEYETAPKLRERARRSAPPFAIEHSRRGFRRTTAGRRLRAAWLRALDRAIPCDPTIDGFLREMRPDLVAVTPLIEPGSPQAEYLRSARALGVRTAHCVASWDNLTNKGLIHGPVDLVAVWNDAMKREAVELHGVSEGRVVVTGAAAFDHWFDWRPSRTRDEFCARVGLPADRPYLLYVCSSKFVAPQEVPFIRAWIERIRCSPGALREAAILVRPHPQNAEQWQGIDLSSFGAVSLWPRAGAAPVDSQTRNDYFDSMHYSAAVVGVNTTAEIESAIVGRPVYTLLAPEFRAVQEGTLHFRHLRQGKAGLLRIAREFDEHLAHLEAAIGGPQDGSQCRRFVEAFVRPHGIDVPATPRLVEALEQLGATPSPVAPRDGVWASMIRMRLAPRAAALERQAKTDPESHAARLSLKAAREAKRHAREAGRRARLAEKVEHAADRRAARARTERVTRQQRLEGLIADFLGMGEVDRRNFLRSVLDAVPRDSFIELNAANKPRKLDYDRADIYLRVTSKTESFRVKACAKEPFTIEWIHAQVRAGDVLYDIGANVGAYSLVAAKTPGGGARVFAFEASYANVSSLCANIALNDVAARVTPMPVALSDRTAMNIFNLRDAGPGGARHALGDAPPEDGPTVFSQPVMMFRLDDLVELFGLPLPNHIKLDVDGGELAVLEGASRTLGSPALRSLLVEVSASLSDAVTDVLGRAGLRLESKISKQNKAGEYAVWYGLFGRAAAAGVLTTADVTRAVKP
jgi:FkbM family methyltransferase